MDGHRASGYVQPPPGHLVPFLSPLFSQHHIWTAPTACNSNNSWNPHERFKSKKSVEILPSTLVSFDGNSFKRSNWEQKIEQHRTKLIEQKFLKQILRSYYKQKCSTTREIFFFSITTKQWSEGKVGGFQWKQRCPRIFGMCWNKVCTAFLTRTTPRQDNWSIPENLPKTQETLIGAEYSLDCNKTKCCRFSDVYCNKVCTTSTNRIAWRQVKAIIPKTLPKPTKHWSEPYSS